MARTEPRLGFVVEVQAAPGVTHAGAQRFGRALHDYFDAHDLSAHGTQLRWAVNAPDHSLSVADQADLLDWVVDQEQVALARVSTLTTRPDPLSDFDGGWLTLCRLDPCVVAATTLYRFGRVVPELYLHALGGFVRRVPR